MNENFPLAVRELIEDEAGYVNDPKDKGGETKFGISKRSYPGVDIKNLTKQHAREIYFKDFWKVCRCDILPSGVDYFVFDTAVLHGPGFAIKMVQRAIKCKVIDGAIGPNTRNLIARWSSNTKYFLSRCATKRIAKYKRIVAFDASQERFFEGWVARTIENYVTTMVDFMPKVASGSVSHENCLDKDSVEQFLLQKFDKMLDDLPKATQLRE